MNVNENMKCLCRGTMNHSYFVIELKKTEEAFNNNKMA